MKLYKAIILTFILLLCVIGMVALFSSCSSSKNVTKERIVIDSSATKELQDSIRLLKTEVTRLEQTIKESEYATYEFDSTKCPQIVFPVGSAMLNKDSIQRLINDLNNGINGLNNKVKRYADGTIEITGRLKNVTQLKEKQSQLIAQQEKLIDSLKQVKQKETVSVNKEEEKKTVTKKTKFLPDWWLFPLGMACGIFLWARFGSGIKTFFSKR